METANYNSVVDQCRHHIPDKMNKSEGEVLLIILYKTGVLSEYLDAVAAGDDDDEDDEDDESVTVYIRRTEFSYHFDFREDVELDSDGRITFLTLQPDNYYDMPPMIERLEKLQSIRLTKCQLLPIEIGHLPLLERIDFSNCANTLFENIPEGLQLPHVQVLEIFDTAGKSGDKLQSCFAIFSDSLEKLVIHGMTRAGLVEILSALQYDDLAFRQSLTTLRLSRCGGNEEDLGRLLFEILPMFPDINILNFWCNEIESLRGIEDRIKQLERMPSPLILRTAIPDSNLRKIDIYRNPVVEKIDVGPKEKEALLTLLGTFNRISNLGKTTLQLGYAPDIENVLRINHAGRKFMCSTGGDITGNSSSKPFISRALLPLILERAHSKSAEIYVYMWRDTKVSYGDRKKCATGLFHLVRHFYGHLLAEDRQNFHRCCGNREMVAALSTAADLNCARVGNNDALERKRKRSY